MDNKKKVIVFIIGLILFLLGIVGFTFAYYTSEDGFDNLFTSALYQTTANEQFVSPTNWKPEDTTPKEKTLTNTGDIPVKVRVSYTESWEDPNGNSLPLKYNNEKVAILNLDNTDDWTKIGNYYYYNDILDTNESTNSFLKSVTFNPNVTNNYTCTKVGNKTTCTSDNDSYEGGSYTLNLTIESIQADAYESVWNPEASTLYGIVKKEYTDNTTYAGLYTGEHKDSFNRSATKDIYYYTTANTDNTTQGNNLLNKINVIFGGYCWQMIRTTDTGGVKMIYNGLPVDGKCENTRSNTNGLKQGSRTSGNMSGTYYYGSEYTYDLSAGTFKLAGITKSTNYLTDKSVIGMYTCKNSDVNATCSTLYYLDELYGTSVDYSYYYPLTIESTNYAQIGVSPFNKRINSPTAVGYMYNQDYEQTYQYTTGTSNASYPSSNTTNLFTKLSLSTSYWFADSIDYDNNGAVKYSLINSYQVTSNSDYPNLVGKYTFMKNSQTYNAYQVYYIAGVSGNTAYCIQLSSNPRITTSYLYGDEFDYGETTSGAYTIKNASYWSSGIDVTGKYVMNETDPSILYYVIGMDSTAIFFQTLNTGNILKYNESLIIGESIVDNLNGTYRLDNTSIVPMSDYVINYANYTSKYICGNSSNVCKNPRYLALPGDRYYQYLNPLDELLIAKTRNGLNLTNTLTVKVDELSKNRANYTDYKYTCGDTSSTCTDENLKMIFKYKEIMYSYAPNRYFGESVTWNGTTYTLNNVVELESTANLTDLSTHHYFCIDLAQTSCNSVGYMFYFNVVDSTYGNSIYYMLLENGIESIGELLDIMLYSDDVNKTDSPIKALLESWYKNNLYNYDDYVDETIYCGNRTMKDSGGMKDNGGMTNTAAILFDAYNDISCPKETDQFSIHNNKAKSKYKIGLISSIEMKMINNFFIRKTSSMYWYMTPYEYFLSYNYPDSYITATAMTGSYDAYQVYGSIGVRPSISLTYGISPSSGSGTMADPYIIDTN